MAFDAPINTMEPEELQFSGKRRWKHTADPTFYTFEEFEAFCEKEGFTKWDPEVEARTTEAGARYLWNMSFEESYEEEKAKPKKEQVDQLHPLPLEVLSTPGSVNVVMQAVEPPPVLVGPSKGGGCLRVTRRGTADCWGGAGPYASMGIEVIDTCPTVVHIRAFTGAVLRAVDNKGKVAWTMTEDPDESAKFELLPRTSQKDRLIVSLMPKGGGTAVGLFALYEAPEHVHHQMDSYMGQDPMERILEGARELMKTKPEFQGNRRHKQDINRVYYNFEEMLRWAVRKFHTTEVEDALDLGRVLWKHMCIAEDADCAQAAKRCRLSRDKDQWNIVIPAKDA